MHGRKNIKIQENHQNTKKKYKNTKNIKIQKKTSKYKILTNKFLRENRAVSEIMWKNIVQPDGLQMTNEYALHDR